MRKDIKKSSYYVWFLGAQESKGLRGAEFVIPVVKSLVQRERDVEPFKVTLQVSHKGLKIIQNIPPAATTTGPGAKGNLLKGAKPEVVKHFIPHHAVTCVLQDDDIVACILLLYNPVTKCPVHVHAYRCDSVETAEVLRGQLQTLIERPDNQKKLNEIEARLRAKGLLSAPPTRARGGGDTGGMPPLSGERGGRRAPLPNVVGGAPRRLTGGGSDGRSTSTRESESSGGSSSERLSVGVGQQERIASLYDSLAAELREKLGASSSTSSGRGGGDKGGGGNNSRGGAPLPPAPILLPPRDYDTVHRQKGNLTAIDLRRCLNANIVGVNVKGVGTTVGVGAGPGGGGVGGARGSSGGSSGIGSDHAPSPDQQDVDADGHFLDNQSSSDEEWAAQPSEDSLFLVQPSRGGGGGGGGWRGADLSLPRARRVHSNGSGGMGGGGGERGSERSGGDSRRPASIPAPAPPPAAATTPTPVSSDARRSRRHAEERQRSPSPPSGPLSPRDRFKDAKEKFQLLERERLEEQRRRTQAAAVAQQQQQHHHHPSRTPPPPPRSPPPRGGGHHHHQQQQQQHRRPNSSRSSPDELPIAPAVQPLHSGRRYRAGSWSRSRDSEDDLEDRPRFFPRGHASLRHGEDPLEDGEEDFDDEDVFDYRMRSRSASNLVRRDSRGAGRLASLEDHPLDDDPRERRSQRTSSRPESAGYRSSGVAGRSERSDPRPSPRYAASPRSALPPPQRHPYDDYSPERERERERMLSPVRGGPRPAPRDDPRGTPSYPRAYPEDIPLERYRSPPPPNRGPQPAPRLRPEPSPERRHKRRTVYDAVEEERRRASHDLAREFKRRSYQDGVSGGPDNYPAAAYQELPDRERYPGLDRESARALHPAAPAAVPVTASAAARAPAGYRHSYAEGGRHHELLHRAASSVSSGRVGIAAVHPY